MAAEVEDTPARAQLLQQLWQFTASSTQTSARLTLLANEAERQNRYDIASRVYQQLIEANPTMPCAGWNRRRNRRWRESVPGCRRTLFSGAATGAHAAAAAPLSSLPGCARCRVANLLPQAVAAAREHAGTLADDRETQLFLVKLCRAAGDLNEAGTLCAQAVADEPAVRIAANAGAQRQSSCATSATQPTGASRRRPSIRKPTGSAAVFLGNRKLHDAYLVAQRAVAYLPADRERRKRLAQVAEWDQAPGRGLAALAVAGTPI